MDAQLAAIDQGLIERVRDRIVAAFEPEAIYLFGSAARGEQRQGSDLDLLVVMDLQAKADSDLRTAHAAIALDPPETETAEFHCQRTIEKCLKALLANPTR